MRSTGRERCCERSCEISPMAVLRILRLTQELVAADERLLIRRNALCNRTAGSLRSQLTGQNRTCSVMDAADEGPARAQQCRAVFARRVAFVCSSGSVTRRAIVSLR